MTLTQIDLLKAIHAAAVAHEAAAASTLQNALATAATDDHPAFAAAAEIAVRGLLEASAYQAGLAKLIAEMTPPAPEATP